MSMRRALRARTWTLAALCAGWVVAWPMLALESTRGLRGILDVSRDRGAYDLVALFYSGSDFVLYAALFLACLVLFRAMLGAAVWLDRDRRALAALRWALKVRSVRVCAAVALLLVLGIAISPNDWRDGLMTAAFCLFLLTVVAALFITGHPETLMRERDIGGWRAYWPGRRAVVAVLLFSLACDVALKFLAIGVGGSAGVWAQIAVWIVTISIDVVVSLIGCAIWFGYRRRASLAEAWAALRRWSFLGAYLGLYAYMIVAACLVVVPMMVVASVSIYIAPQYGNFESLPHVLRWLDGIGRMLEDSTWLFAMLPVALWLAFAHNRLVFRDGLAGRLGPDAPNR